MASPHLTTSPPSGLVADFIHHPLQTSQAAASPQPTGPFAGETKMDAWLFSHSKFLRAHFKHDGPPSLSSLSSSSPPPRDELKETSFGHLGHHQREQEQQQQQQHQQQRESVDTEISGASAAEAEAEVGTAGIAAEAEARGWHDAREEVGAEGEGEGEGEAGHRPAEEEVVVGSGGQMGSEKGERRGSGLQRGFRRAFWHGGKK